MGQDTYCVSTHIQFRVQNGTYKFRIIRFWDRDCSMCEATLFTSMYDQLRCSRMCVQPECGRFFGGSVQSRIDLRSAGGLISYVVADCLSPEVADSPDCAWNFGLPSQTRVEWAPDPAQTVPRVSVQQVFYYLQEDTIPDITGLIKKPCLFKGNLVFGH